MSLLLEIKALSEIRKNQQIMSFYILFANALLIAYTAKAYVINFGAEGLILKDYAISTLGLMLLIPVIGKAINKHPMSVFHLSIALEVLALLGYFLTNKGIHPTIILPISTFILMVSVFLMRPLVNRVNSLIVDGCADYSLLDSKLSAIYTVLGSIFGTAIIYFDISTNYTVILLLVILLVSRFYRNKVFSIVYSEQNKTTLPEVGLKIPAP
jgi:hypothetical protein